MNLPICVFILGKITWLLRVQYTKRSSWMHTLSHIDWIRSFLSIGSSYAFMLGLVFGWSEYQWSSWRAILSLALGFSGVV
jgi:hypothetical protein